MKRIVRLTESDLARIVKRVISEKMDPQDPAKHFDTVENVLIPNGFKKDISSSKTMGIVDLIKGSDHNGIIVRYYSPYHTKSKEQGYVVDLIVDNVSKKTWTRDDVNMYDVIKEVKKYLKSQ
jgi:hypothetical protein|tara:strand:- start:4755 stop:5120 length:366 start_codon:yes stop_codon:yes gene_type:complete